MNVKTLIAAAIATAFAMPLSAGAAGDKASSGDSGAEKMFKSLDKNNDGFLSKDEVKGTPYDKEFTTLDKNHDSKLSRQEHASAPEHAGDKSTSTGGTSGGAMSSGKSGAGGSAPGKGY
jgi:hypothetical protein